MKHYSTLTMIAVGALLCAGCAHDEEMSSEVSVPLSLCPPANTRLSDGTLNGESPRAGGAHILSRAYTDADLFVPGTGSGEDVSEVSNFLPFNKLYPTPINKNFSTIGVFLTQDTRDSYNALSGYFHWKSDNTWGTTVSIRPGDFYLFGYMPSNVGSVNAHIEKRPGSDTWTDGARMTISNLNTVTPADVCVVVGAYKAEVPNPKPVDWSPLPIDDPTVVEQLRQGIYGYHGTEQDNFVYLLLDHLYTNVNMELAVEEKYAALRTIVLTEVYMKTPVRNTVDAVITLGKSATSPIEYISIGAPTGDTPTRAQIFPSLPEYKQIVAVENHGEPTSIPGYFAPGLTTQDFEFEFHYNVYDKEGENLSNPENPVFGNLVREDCIAINKWSLPGTGVKNGKSFKVTAIIRPTYLFQLSDPDLDNPSIVLQ